MLGINTVFAKRLTLGKTLGFIVGLLAFIMLGIMSDATLMLRFGVLFWYTTFGVFIALLGIMDEHPTLHISMPFWFRGLFFGGWMNFVLVLVAYPVMTEVFVQLQNFGLPAFSPFLLVIEGMLVGLLIDFLCTKYFGDGKALLQEKEKKKKKLFGMF